MSTAEKQVVESINQSGWLPQGRAVMVMPKEAKKLSSTIVIPETVTERMQMVETEAVVIAIGGEAWADEKAPRARVGDTVLITKYAGVIIKGKQDGKVYRLVNDRDIFCRGDES